MFQDKVEQRKEVLIWDLYNLVVQEGATKLDRKMPERGVGFLVHLSRPFLALFQYLKGIYSTMKPSRIERVSERWKLSWRGVVGGRKGKNEF